MKHSFIFSLVLSAFVVSCGSDDNSSESTIKDSSVINTGIPATTITAPVSTGTTTLPVNQPASSATVAPATVATGLNPAHGAPGHRCEIPVGAPLDSKPAQPNATISQPVMTNNTGQKMTVTPAASAPGATALNPEHGKPGHRCDIAVGAPLDSKPQQ